MITSQVLLRLHFCEHALRALVATHPEQQKFRACVEEIFASSLSPEASPEHQQQREAFLQRLFVGIENGK